MRQPGMHGFQFALLLALFAGTAIAQKVSPAAIEGRVFRRGTNEPLPGASVQLQPLNEPETFVVQAGSDGRFLFHNIPPGAYGLSAVRSGFIRAEYGKRRPSDPDVTLNVGPSQTIAGLQLPMIQAGAIDGRVTDSRGAPMAAVLVRAFQIAYFQGQRAWKTVQTVTTDDAGNYRLFALSPGQYYVSAGILSQDAPAPTYYPDISDARNAGSIDVSAGATVGGINIRFGFQPRRHVRGTVDFSGAGAADASVQITSQIPILNASSIAVSADRRTGAFDIPSVAPGAYQLTALAGKLMAQTTIEVRDSDVNDIAFTFTSTIELPVQVTLDSAATGSNRINVSEMTFGIRLDSPAPGVLEALYGSDKGSFTIRVTPGNYRITAPSIPSHAYIQTIRLGTSDVLRDGLHVDAGTAGHLEIVIGSNPGVLEGTVTTPEQQPGPNTVLVLAPALSQRKRLELFFSSRSDASGHFKIENIPPGDYTVFSWEDIEPFSWLDPDFMRTYENSGRAIHIEAGSHLNLQITSIPAQ